MSKEFQWTDELVKEYGLSFFKKEMDINTSIAQFKESKKPKPLFITEDGVEIFSKEALHIVHISKYFKKTYAIVSATTENANVGDFIYNEAFNKYFLNEEAANDYILENKPCLSMKDALSCYRPEFEVMKMALITEVKSKL